MQHSLTRILLKLTGMIVVLYAVSCADAAPEQQPGSGAVSGDGDEITLSVSTCPARSRTHMGPQAEGYIPVYWSDGDRINVNGQISEPLAVDPGQELTDAQFKIKNIASPYYLLYPADIYVSADEDKLVTIDIPSSQAYTADSFAEGAAILYGASNEGEIDLNNLCGAIKLSLMSATTATVSAIEVISREESIAGKFTLDLTNGDLASLDAIRSVTVALPQGGLVLSPSATDVYVTLPKGDYAGFTIKILDDERKTMNCTWSRMGSGDAPGSGVTVSAGRVVDFGGLEFAATHREITSAEDFAEFVAAVLGTATDRFDYTIRTDPGDYSVWCDPDGVVNLCADITLSSTDFSKDSQLDVNCVKVWDGIFEGNGHTITVEAAKVPLFMYLTETGVIRNLTTGGNLTVPRNSWIFGSCALVTHCYGTIDNCVNKMNITYSGTSGSAVSGFVRTMYCGTIKNCVNEGTLTVNYGTLGSSVSCGMGGIAVKIENTAPALIENCTNKGNISLSVASFSTNALYISYCGLGGIAGWLNSGTETTYTTFKTCTNEGSVSINAASGTSFATVQTSVGGIVGLAAATASATLIGNMTTTTHYYTRIEECVNRGTIKNQSSTATASNSVRAKSAAGGIVGTISGLSNKHSEMIGCDNFGTITGGSSYSRSQYCTVLGGLVGIGGHLDLSGCTVKSTVGWENFMTLAVGGIFGNVIVPFSIDNCSVYVQLIQAGPTNHQGLVTGTSGTLESLNLTGSEISGSRFGGSTAYSKTTGSGFTTTYITSGNLNDYLFSATDKNHASVGAVVTANDNTYWDGN